MFDDIIKKRKPEICKELDFSKVEIWGQKTLKTTNKEVIVCQDKTEQDQMVMDQ